MTSNKRWMLGLGLGLAVLTVAALVQDQPTKRPRGAAAMTPVNVDAQTLWDAYNQNEVAASSRYSGELLRIKGTVESIGIDRDGIPYLDLKAYGGMGVRANFNKGGREDLARVSKGDSVAVTCVGVGKSVLVHVKDCRFN